MTTNTQPRMPKPDDEHTLNEQELAFCREYVRTGNASAAVRAAGYPVKKANEKGCKLLKRADIAAAVDEMQQEARRALNLDQTTYLDRLCEIAYLDPTEHILALLLDVPGHSIADDLKNEKRLRDRLRELGMHAVKSFRVTHNAAGYRNLAIEFHDKLRAMQMLAEVKGWLRGAGTQETEAADVQARALALMDKAREVFAKREPKQAAEAVG